MNSISGCCRGGAGAPRTASSPAMPFHSHTTFSRPRNALSSSSICSRDRCGLRDGCSSVSSVAISVLRARAAHFLKQRTL